MTLCMHHVAILFKSNKFYINPKECYNLDGVCQISFSKLFYINPKECYNSDGVRKISFSKLFYET